MTNSSTAHPISTVLVPLGDLDCFSLRRFVDAAAAYVKKAQPHDSVTVDLSAVPFCDSSVASLMDWVDGLPDVLEVTVVTGPAVDWVLGLLTDGWVHRPLETCEARGLGGPSEETYPSEQRDSGRRPSFSTT